MSSHEPLDLDLGELASRRREIMVRIYERVEVSDLGFVLDDKPSPCHIWRWSAISRIRNGEQSEPRRTHERTFFVLPEHHLQCLFRQPWWR